MFSTRSSLLASARAVALALAFGVGCDATEHAGRMKQRGQRWVLLPKP